MSMLLPLSELRARYLLSRDAFRTQDMSVKARAFMPSTGLKTSVFRVLGLSENQTWALGNEHVAQPQGRRLHGWAEVPESQVASIGLVVEPDDDPPRHANIAGWPPEKHRQKLLAQELAAIAVLKLRAGEGAGSTAPP